VGAVDDGSAAHWDAAYQAKDVSDVSWFQPRPDTSCRLIADAAPQRGTVVDIGAGASTLAECLVEDGWPDVTVLDVSNEALATVRDRLVGRGGVVSFVVADLLAWKPERTYDVWHDRAVFHFFVDPLDRERYVSTATASVSSGGVLVLATFASDGPTQCSGLPVARYDSAALADVFGEAFTLEHAEREEHLTPWDAVQPFTWVVLRRN
jgi:SAM-dependent methyltransferase